MPPATDATHPGPAAPAAWTQRRRRTCRACEGNHLKPFLVLGPQPLANAFLQSPEQFAGEGFYPLDVYYCADCSLVQLLDVINPDVLFRNYIYVSGTSETMAAHNAEYAATAAGLLSLSPTDLVVEIGSNDGSLLACFQRLGVRTLGVEPATNIAQTAQARGIDTVNRFWDVETAGIVRDTYGPARAIIGNNVLAHVDETRAFLRGCRDLLAPDGLLMIEAPYVAELLKRLEYDTIYHEHLCYFSVTTLMRLCQGVGLSIVRVDHQPVHGGSLRIYAAHQEQAGGHAAAVVEEAQGEAAQGLTTFGHYERFAAAVGDHRSELMSLLRILQAESKSLAGYGAPAKGNTLLNYCGIGAGLLPYTVDRNPLKVGMFTPGMHIPVLPASALVERQPDYVLILAWNFAAEIMRQQQAYTARGGRFIIPLPRPEVV